MKKITTLLFSFILLGACNIDSPISAVQSFYKQIQEKNYKAACQTMVNPKLQALNETQLKNCEGYYQQNYTQMVEFSVENALPLSSDKLQALGISEGFIVYYTAKLNPEVKHEQINVTKINGKNVLIWEEK